VFGALGVGWVMVRCPRDYDELMRRAGGVWEPGARWLVERRRIGPVIRELESTVDPLFRQAGIQRTTPVGDELAKQAAARKGQGRGRRAWDGWRG
jgi:hypothetical protein